LPANKIGDLPGFSSAAVGRDLSPNACFAARQLPRFLQKWVAAYGVSHWPLNILADRRLRACKW